MPGARVLRAGTPFALLLFLATSMAPRASWFAHHHDGGDRFHTHPWGTDALAEHHHDDDHHHHPLHDDGGPGFEDDDDDHGLHVHWQSPFQPATRTEAPRVVHLTTLCLHDAPLHLAAGLELRRSPSARAPPPPLRAA